MLTQTDAPGSLPALTEHSRTRMQQRGITERMILLALAYGERAWSHDCLCYRLTERSLCRTPHAAECDRLRGLCVVLARDGCIVTVKWDFRLRRPGPLRRANRENWRALQHAALRREGVPTGQGEPLLQPYATCA